MSAPEERQAWIAGMHRILDLIGTAGVPFNGRGRDERYPFTFDLPGSWSDPQPARAALAAWQDMLSAARIEHKAAPFGYGTGEPSYWRLTWQHDGIWFAADTHLSLVAEKRVTGQRVIEDVEWVLLPPDPGAGRDGRRRPGVSATVAERVALGEKFMNENDPGWWSAGAERAIDLDSLDLEETDLCVLGQRCPLEVLAARVKVEVAALDAVDFGEAYDAYARHLSGVTGWDLFEWARDRGFTADGLAPAETWADLTAEWKRVIADRRAAA